MTLERFGDFVHRWELWIVWLLVVLGLATVPVSQGHISIIWDTLNHQIYLGWIGERPRFDQDFLAAGWQSYQYPYLYWPAYKLALANLSGVEAGLVLVLLQSLAAPPVWLVARMVCPGRRLPDIAMRWMGVGLAFSGGATLSLVDTTSNDLLAGIPLIWAVALGMLALDESDAPPQTRLGRIALSGVCAGLSVAFKLSNGPLALALPLLWLFGKPGPREAVQRVAIGCIATSLAFVVAYAPWGWQLWQQFGNPVYPFYDPAFDGLRDLLGWRAT